MKHLIKLFYVFSLLNLTLPQLAFAEFGQGCVQLLSSTTVDSSKYEYYKLQRSMLWTKKQTFLFTGEAAVFKYYRNNFEALDPKVLKYDFQQKELCEKEKAELNELLNKRSKKIISSSSPVSSVEEDCKSCLEKFCDTEFPGEAHNYRKWIQELQKQKAPEYKLWLKNMLFFNLVAFRLELSIETQNDTLYLNPGQHKAVELLNSVSSSLRSENIYHTIYFSYEEFNKFRHEAIQILLPKNTDETNEINDLVAGLQESINPFIIPNDPYHSPTLYFKKANDKDEQKEKSKYDNDDRKEK